MLQIELVNTDDISMMCGEVIERFILQIGIFKITVKKKKKKNYPIIFHLSFLCMQCCEYLFISAHTLGCFFFLFPLIIVLSENPSL